MKQAFISICIPAYNQDQYLRRCLDSIVSQTFREFEVIVSDDSSNDLVYKLVAQYQGRLPIIYNRNQPGLGSPANWNCCMDLSSGEWIKFMHHDDWFSTPTSLQKFADAAKSRTADFIFCDSEILDVSSGKSRMNQPPLVFVQDLKKDPLVLFTNNRIGAPSAVMFRRNELRFDEKISYTVDIDFYMRYLLNHRQFVFIPSALIVNTSGNARQVTAASLNKQTQVGEYAYLYNKIIGPKLPDASQARLFRSLFRKYSIRSQQEIVQLAGAPLRPSWYFSLLMLISRFR